MLSEIKRIIKHSEIMKYEILTEVHHHTRLTVLQRR